MEGKSLNHVYMLTDKGMIHVTCEDVKRIHPIGHISAGADRDFLQCRLCGKPVEFRNGEQRFYFCHPKIYDNSCCPDYTGRVINYAEYIKNNIYQELPIRLNINGRSFCFELGVIIPQYEMLKSNTIKIQLDDRSFFEYSVERLKENGFTYLNVGKAVSEYYKLILNKQSDNMLVAVKYDGIRKCSLFDGVTKKKIPDSADAIVNHEYYLLEKKNIKGRNSVIVTEESSVQIGGWRLYKVKATKVDDQSAKFFLHYGYFLTEKPIILNVVWPAYINTPYVIKHHSSTVFFHINGEYSYTQSFPRSSLFKYPFEKPKVFELMCNTSQQLITAGHSNVQHYTYLRIADLNEQETDPHVEVTDVNSVSFSSGVHYKLPADNTLRFLADFDGYISLKKDGKLQSRYDIKSKSYCSIDHLEYGHSIELRQGLDVVWSVTFEKPDLTAANNNDLLLEQLKRCKGKTIKIPERFGAVILKFKNDPKVMEWLSGRVREGFISEQAIKILRRVYYDRLKKQR